MSGRKDSKKEINERYWQSIKDSQIKKEYQEYLKEEGLEPSPDHAYLFAKKKTGDGFQKYNGYIQRDLIIFLASELPPMYD